MQVRLLGPVDVVVDGEPRPVRGLRRKAVLAVLALQAGEVVSTDQLTDVVWGEATPATAANTLQSHMSYLRTVLGDKCAILARAPGYLLDLCGDGTDVREAERLLDQGMRPAAPAEMARQLRRALNLWRGQPLADVTGVAWLEEQAGRGDHAKAIGCYERAISLSRELADRFNEADALSSLGDVHYSAGDTGAAHRAWGEALRIFGEIDHPDHDKAHAKLRLPVREVALAG